MVFKSPEGLPIINAGGNFRKLAALRPTVEAKAAFRLFSTQASPDPSTWLDCDYAFYGSPILDQGQHGSCTNHAGVTALDITRRMNGQTPVLLSGTFAYAQVNGGRDQGASVSAILKVFEQMGDCLHSECGTDQIFKSQIPQSAYETAKKYQVQEAFLCNSFEELCEAINRGFPVAFGIEIGQNFSRLSSEGICPLPDTVVGGHALCGMGLKKSSRGTWLIRFQNSWTTQWGQGGYAYLTKGHFSNMVDGYAIMYGENIDPPPIAKDKKELDIATPGMIHTDPEAIAPVRQQVSSKSRKRTRQKQGEKDGECTDQANS